MFANLALNALALALVCHFVHDLPVSSAQKIPLFAAVIFAYASGAFALYLQAKSPGCDDLRSLQKAKAQLLAVLPEAAPENPDWLKRPIDEIASQVAAELDNLRLGQKAILDYSKELICSLDENYRICQINANAQEIWLHPNLSLIGASLLDLVHESDRRQFEQYFEQCRGAFEEKPLELRMRGLNGKAIDFSWSIEWSPSLRSYYCIGTDISAGKEIERLKAEITSMVSHDLRAPISSLSFFVDGLIAGEFGSLSQIGSKQVLVLKESLQQVLRLINQLLDAEKLDSGSLHLELKVLPAASIVESAVAVLGPLAQKKNLTIEAGESEELVFADFDRSVQIMNNLLSNAIKWSPESSKITVLISVDDDKVKFEVKDQGPGISVESWGLIFERFKTLNDTVQSGAGLGLYISKTLTEVQGGQMGLYSVPGKGASFWFWLKRATEKDLPGYLED